MTEITDRTLALILAGGVGSRLYPLTAHRAKPAVPFGGKYRIIDFTLSNCLESGLRRILVLTQYKSHSLQKHLRDGWSIFNPSLGEYITPVPPQMRTGEERWYEGTADAVHQNLYLVERSGAELVLILSGDHIYRMDYGAMLRAHRKRGAAVTVACMQVPLEEASSFGVVGVDDAERIVDFEEKPPSPRPDPGDSSCALVSMGIYAFSTDVLLGALSEMSMASSSDFGKDILPALIGKAPVFSYPFGGSSGRVTVDRYWRDVGTIDAYFEANQDLLEPMPPLDLYQPDWKIRTYDPQNPPARTTRGKSGRDALCMDSIICAGAIIAGGHVRYSILSPNVRVGDGADVARAILLEGVVVGEGTCLRRVVVDKHVRIPPGETIGRDPEKDRARFSVSEKGVVVVGRDAFS